MATIYHLGIKKGSTTWTVPIYDNTAEAGSAYSYIKYGGKSGYIPLCSTSDSRATGGRVKEHTGSEFAISISGAPPYTKKTYSNPGTYSFTVPAGVNKLRCEIAGAGGGGGSGRFWYDDDVTGRTDGSAGGKGGNGNKWNRTFTVSPGNTITITVGSGGAGGSKPTVNLSNKGSSGGSSSCNGTTSGGGEGGKGGTFRGAGAAGANSGNGNGGAGGAGGSSGGGAGSRGNNGWVIVEYGMGVQ